MTFLCSKVWGLVLLAAFGAGFGGNEGGGAPPEGSGTPQEGGAGSRVISLTLTECVERAYRHNVALRMSRDAAAAAATDFDAAEGAFDPVFFSEVRGGENIRPSGALLIGGIAYQEEFDEDNFNLQSGFRGLLLSGATYQVDLALTRTYQSGASPYFLNPQVANQFSFQIKQPLLKGGWTTYNRAESLKAILGSRREDYNLASDLNETLFATIQAYWNLAYALEDLETTQKSLELAEDLLRINTRKMKEGIFTKIEVLEASADVATRREQVITARNEVKSAEDALKKLIFPSAVTREWNFTIDPLTNPEPLDRAEPDPSELLVEALENRPDYLALKAEEKSKEVEVMQASNETLPALDLTGAYQLNALGSNYGNSFNDIERRKYRSFSVALSLEVPIGNRTARSRERRSMIELRRAVRALADKRISIQYELREAARDIALQRERVKAAGESQRLSLERYQGELKRLQAGRSISYLVREAERNHFEESLKENRARLDYQIALAKLEKVKGTLLERFGFGVPSGLTTDWVYARLR